MRKNYKYILFWLIYSLVFTHTNAVLLKKELPTASLIEVYVRCMLATILFLSPQIMLVQYVLTTLKNKIQDVSLKTFTIVVQLIGAYLLTILIIRVLSKYIMAPYLYSVDAAKSIPLFDLLKTISTAIYVIFPIGVLTLSNLISSLIRQRERERNLIKEKMVAELHLLKTQLNPHFLFNTLNNIYALTRKKSDKAADAVMKLSELLSFMLYEAGKGDITIQQEIKFINDYIALEKIRYTDRLKIDVEYNIDNFNETISPLLFVPLIENAFKHGAGDSLNESYIEIQISLKDKQLEFYIENSFDQKFEVPSKEGIGLNNVKRQLELAYKEQEMTVYKQKNVFCVKIKINLKGNGKI